MINYKFDEKKQKLQLKINFLRIEAGLLPGTSPKRLQKFQLDLSLFLLKLYNVI